VRLDCLRRSLDTLVTREENRSNKSPNSDKTVEMASNCHLIHDKGNPTCIDAVGSMNDNTSGGCKNHVTHPIDDKGGKQERGAKTICGLPGHVRGLNVSEKANPRHVTYHSYQPFFLLNFNIMFQPIPVYPRLGCGFLLGRQTSTLTPTPLYPTQHPMGFTLPLPIPSRNGARGEDKARRARRWRGCTA